MYAIFAILALVAIFAGVIGVVLLLVPWIFPPFWWLMDRTVGRYYAWVDRKQDR